MAKPAYLSLLDCPQVAADLALARASLDELGLFIEGLAPRANAQALQDFLREVRLRAQRIRNIGWNLAVLAACQGSQDARDELAKQLASRARASMPICSRPWPRSRI